MNERPSAAGRGLMAAVALVVCCALPALIGAGFLATVGGVLRNPLIILAGIVVLAGAVGYAWRRRQRGQVCVPPTRERSATERDRHDRRLLDTSEQTSASNNTTEYR